MARGKKTFLVVILVMILLSCGFASADEMDEAETSPLQMPLQVVGQSGMEDDGPNEQNTQGTVVGGKQEVSTIIEDTDR